ncbi:MAG: zinc ABC transporter substrate-binding protein, partial [Muribaculaceae bacterium]|nr:zinc ABC transporter substrate-binding protein [Muribaculaceae bacterium]
SDPENFDPTIATLRQVADSRYYLTTSTPGFEQRLGQLIHDNFRNVNIVDVTDGIDIISGTHNRVEIESKINGDHHADHSHEAGHSHDTDPHLFSSVANARIIADNMLALVCEIDTANAAYYRENHHRLINRLDSLDKVLYQDIRQACEEKGSHTVIVMHPILSYFARDYRIRQVALEESGKEASPRYLKESIEYARETQPFAFVIERGHMLPQMTEMARHLDIPIYELSLNDYEWFRNMEQLGHRLKSK